MKFTTAILSILSVFALFSCSIENLFEQPEIQVIGYRLLELPADTAFLEIDMTVTNMDKRQVHVADVDYQVVLEGITLPEQHATVDTDIYPDSTIDMTLPLAMVTSDAIKILAKLDAGEELTYSVTGLFHVDDPVYNLFDLPLMVSGTAEVDAGYEDFYEMPGVSLGDISGNFTQNSSDSYIFDFEVACLVQNNDDRAATIDEIEYTVTIEGIQSETHHYSDRYNFPFHLDGNASDSLTLPLLLTLDAESGAQLATAIQDGSIDYSVEGIFHTTNVDSIDLDFSLPLYLTGSTDADILSTLFVQPTVTVTGYELKELPGDTTHLDIKMLLTNNDTRTALIHDVNYTVTVDGLTAIPEYVVVDQTIPTDTVTLVMPLTLLTSDAIQILSKLDAGEELPYEVTGIFHIDDPVLNQLDLPIDIAGIAVVEVGYEDFYEQPEVTVNNMSGNYHINGFTSYTITYDVNCTVQNLEARAATVDEIEYTVTIEGTKSAKHYYSNAYSTNFEIGASASENLTLPVTFNLGISSGAAMVAALSDGTVDYVVEGTFHVILVDGTDADFTLPLYVTGSVPATMVAN